MIPKTENAINLTDEIQFESPPSKTFSLNVEKEKFNGYIDHIEAMKQAIYLILNIERYENIIYSWNYGVELSDLFGQDKYFVMAELPRRISEALLQDDRIREVKDFDFDIKGKVINCTFTVVTIYGEIETEKVVKI